MATLYVRIHGSMHNSFDPGGGKPVIDRDGVAVVDTDVPGIRAKAQAHGVQLDVSLTPWPTKASTKPLYTYIPGQD